MHSGCSFNEMFTKVVSLNLNLGHTTTYSCCSVLFFILLFWQEAVKTFNSWQIKPERRDCWCVIIMHSPSAWMGFVHVTHTCGTWGQSSILFIVCSLQPGNNDKKFKSSTSTWKNRWKSRNSHYYWPLTVNWWWNDGGQTHIKLAFTCSHSHPHTALGESMLCWGTLKHSVCRDPGSILDLGSILEWCNHSTAWA